MSEHDPFDGRIRRGLDDLGAGAAHLAAPAPVAGIRRRAARRRNVLAAGVITAAMVAGGGAVVLADSFDRSTLAPVVEPTHSPSPSPAPTGPSPTLSPSTTPSVPTTTAAPAPPPTTPPSTPPAPPPPPPSATVGPWPAGDPATEIPPGFTLPSEGETLGDDYTGWDTSETLDSPWPWQVCGQDTYAGDADRTDFRDVAMSGYGESSHHLLVVWSDAFEAVDVMAQLRGAIQGCEDESTGNGYVHHWDLRELDLGGEGFLAVSNITQDGQPSTGGVVLVAVRVGTAIYVLFGSIDGYPTLDSGVAVEVEARVREFTPNMCVFTLAGCPG